MADEFKLRRGLRKVFVAEVLSDDNGESGYLTGTPFHLIPAGTMTRTASSENTNVWFDDVVFSAVGTEGATAISITGASLRAPEIARLLGKTIDSTTGAILDAGEYVEKYYAMLGECEGVDGSTENFVFLKGTFAVPEEDDKTKDATTDANGMTLNFNAIQTTHIFESTGKVAKRVVIDSKTTVMKTNKVWEEQVITPDNITTFCEKKIATTGISVTPSTATVAVNGTTALTAALTPSGAQGTITWSTSAPAVATVSATGVVTGKTEGTVVITATSDGLSASCTVTVTA